MSIRLFGVETEYALSAVDRAGHAVDRAHVLNELMMLARARLPHLPEPLGAGVFLQCGARFYVDAGQHPELSTPECTHPDELVRYVRVGDRILADLARALEVESGLAEVLVLRHNVDPYQASSWGSHESYAHRSDARRLPRQLIPHLVSRLIYTGAGGFEAGAGHRIAFTLAPRAAHLVAETSPDSVRARGIVHLKDEPLARDGAGRLHLICGETLCSDVGLWLRIGATALVVAMIEAGLRPGDGVQLGDPLSAMRAFAADPTLRATAARVGAAPLTALAVQRHYLEQACRHARHACMPPWAEQVCDRWGDVLDRLEAGADAVALELDWAIKLALYRRHAAQRGVDWDALPVWNEVATALVAARHRAGLPAEQPLTALIGPSSPIPDDVSALTARLAARAQRWETLPAFLALQGELFELDTRFGQLGPRGVFAALDAARVLRHRLVAEDDVARGVRAPPATTRAHVRGTQVGLLHGKAGYSCDWSAVWEPSGRRMIDLGNPLTTEGRWVRAPRASLHPPGPEGRVSAWHGEAMAHYHRGRHGAALRLFQRAGRLAGGPRFQMALGPSRFWAATLLHNMGRLGEALATLESIEPALADDDTLYKALTRRVLVLIERPAPRAEIEAALERVGAEMAARNRAGWRSRILLAQARLHEARGAHDAAVRIAAEAMARAQQEANAIAFATHVRTALGTTLQAQRWADAAALIADCSALELARSEHVAAVLDCGRSVLARVRGDVAAAVQLARSQERLLGLRDERGLRILAGETLVRALLCAGDVAAAREGLGPLLALRGAEVAHDRFAVRLLWADYQLARAQRGAGLPVVDPVTGRAVGELAPTTTPPALSEQRLRAAEQSYARAGDEGRRLDARLECDWRARAIADRLALVETTRRQVAADRARRTRGPARRDASA